MNKILKCVSVGIVLATAVSCNLDLIPKGTTSYEPGQQIITNESDLVGYEANVMYSFRALEYGTYDIAPDVMVDYFNAVVGYGNNYGMVHRTDGSFTPGDSDVATCWNNPYSAIKNFNIFIEGAKVVPADLKDRADVARGEAFIGRAFAYMNLARLFGKAYDPATANQDLCVPLVTTYDQTARPERATVAEVYGQIKADLDSAAVLLASVPGEVRASRPTIDAVNFMYARYYLDTRNYAEAFSHAMSVIESEAGYALSSTAQQMEAEWLNDEGTEPVLQFYASPAEGVGGHSVYTQMSSNPEIATLYYQPWYIPSQKLVDAYSRSDLRFSCWFDGGDYPVYVEGNLYNSRTTDFYVFRKYFGNQDLNTSNIPNSGHAIKPFLISEMYLIAAEAGLEEGGANLSEATAALNALQGARGAAITALDETNLHDEWYRETVGEGLRMSCLKRWGEGFNGRPGQQGAYNIIEGHGSGSEYFENKVAEADDRCFLWPIPTYEMQTNLNLVQNPGYGNAAAE